VLPAPVLQAIEISQIGVGLYAVGIDCRGLFQMLFGYRVMLQTDFDQRQIYESAGIVRPYSGKF